MKTSNTYYEKYAKTIVMDIDDTISFANTYNDVGAYSEAIPNTELISVMQKLASQGYKFILHTARGWISCKEDVRAAESKYRKQIEAWLQKYHVPYDKLLFGKPYGIWYVDDKSLRPEEFIKKFR